MANPNPMFNDFTQSMKSYYKNPPQGAGVGVTGFGGGVLGGAIPLAPKPPEPEKEKPAPPETPKPTGAKPTESPKPETPGGGGGGSEPKPPFGPVGIPWDPQNGGWPGGDVPMNGGTTWQVPNQTTIGGSNARPPVVAPWGGGDVPANGGNDAIARLGIGRPVNNGGMSYPYGNGLNTGVNPWGAPTQSAYGDRPYGSFVNASAPYGGLPAQSPAAPAPAYPTTQSPFGPMWG